jgi:DNA-directed RNA polymerase specialized sigma subunit
VAYTYVLPKNIEAAIKQLNDQELDRLVSAALEERSRRKRLVTEQSQRKRYADAVAGSLPKGKRNAVKAASKAGLTPTRIAREFGLSRVDVQRALANDANDD